MFSFFKKRKKDINKEIIDNINQNRILYGQNKDSNYVKGDYKEVSNKEQIPKDNMNKIKVNKHYLQKMLSSETILLINKKSGWEYIKKEFNNIEFENNVVIITNTEFSKIKRYEIDIQNIDRANAGEKLFTLEVCECKIEYIPKQNKDINRNIEVINKECKHNNMSKTAGLQSKKLYDKKYDERGFILNTARHRNGTKYDDFGYDKYGYDKYGYDKNGFKMSGIHRNGTKFDEYGCDRYGYDKYGAKRYEKLKNEYLDKDYKKIIYDTNDNEKRNLYSCSQYNKYGFNKDDLHKNGTYFDDEGYGADGFNRQGLDRQGYNRGGYNKEGYNRKGYDKDGYNREGYNELGYDKEGYNKEGYNKEGYNKLGYNKEGYDQLGYNKEGYNKEGYNKLGYNKEGYDKLGYNKLGYDKLGYDKQGYDKEGYDERGFDRDGFDIQGYNIHGEYFGFIDKYLKDNMNIKVKNNSLIYSEKIKELFIDIERAKKTFGIEDYVASLSHIRRGAEKFIDEVLMNSRISSEKFVNLSQYEKIKLSQCENILPNRTVQLLDMIRDCGNYAVHKGHADKENTQKLLESIQNEIHNWISNNN